MFDKVFHRPDGPAHWAKAKLVRYADDFGVLARFQSWRLSQFIEWLPETRMGLELNREKTRVVNLNPVGENLDFLGFTGELDAGKSARPVLRGGRGQLLPYSTVGLFAS